MTEIRLTVQDAVEQLLMSQSTIYTWIDKGFLQVEETPAGRVIVISEDELEQIRDRNLKSKRNRVSKQMTSTAGAESVSQVVEAEVVTNTDEILKATNFAPNSDILKLISDLASKAGKYELIEDIQKQKQEDIEFWRNEYFRLNSENARLQTENAQLIRDRADLQAKVKEMEEIINLLQTEEYLLISFIILISLIMLMIPIINIYRTDSKVVNYIYIYIHMICILPHMPTFTKSIKNHSQTVHR